MGGENQNNLEEEERLFVQDGDRVRPFMRGIMIHSLMVRGVPYEDALRTAQTVREKFEPQGTVLREDLAKAVAEILGAGALAEHPEAVMPNMITVFDNVKGTANPFSKGILSQSLLAAAIEPNDAFDVARDIEGQLRLSGTRSIERRELRRRAYNVLQRQLGEDVAQRYLVWRKYQDPADRPIMILLGGVAGTGKTSLALEVAHRLGIQRILSTDSIRQIMRLMLSRELIPALHASSFDAHRVRGALERHASVIDGFYEQAATVSVGVRAALDRAIEENSSLILDGVSLVPGLIDLEPYRDKAHVIFLVVAVLDEEVLAERYKVRAEQASRRPARRYLENLQEILQMQEHFLELAERYEVPIVDNASFERSVKFIIRHVTEQLQKVDAFDPAEFL